MCGRKYQWNVICISETRITYHCYRLTDLLDMEGLEGHRTTHLSISINWKLLALEPLLFLAHNSLGNIFPVCLSPFFISILKEIDFTCCEYKKLIIFLINTIFIYNIEFKTVIYPMCQLSHITCRVSSVTFHLTSASEHWLNNCVNFSQYMDDSTCFTLTFMWIGISFGELASHFLFQTNIQS